MRKLVTLRTVAEIKPILGADAIEMARVDGWECVVKKGEFKVGDNGLYFEIDSFLPAEDPRFAFLEPRFSNWEGKRGARIRTIKLRGQLSQGLLLPEKDFVEVALYSEQILSGEINVEEHGTLYEHDFSEELKVEKWERSLHPSLGGMARGNFPSFIPKTDEERIQNIPRTLEKYVGETFEETIKLDGSSCTMYFLSPDSPYNDKEQFPYGRFGVCSRNLDLKEAEGNAFWQIAREIFAEEKLRKVSSEHLNNYSFAVQGELISPIIQSNYEKVDKNEYYVYKVFCIDTQSFLNPVERRNFTKSNGFNHVPVLDTQKNISEAFLDISDILKYAEGPGMNKGVSREGVVFKHNNSQFSFKAISNKYLLKEE